VDSGERVLHQGARDNHVILIRDGFVKIALSYGRRVPDGIEIGVRLTQPELASLCGAAEVTTQKILRTFRGQGLVMTGYRYLIITDMSGLRAVAELGDYGH
jgi:CRP/FNR family transcriptional regulator, cyclic AMP receptor protein